MAGMLERFVPGGEDTWSRSLGTYLDTGDLDKGSNFVKNYNSQVETKALLLEHLATALGCPPSSRFESPRVRSNGPLHDALKPIVRHAGQWPQALLSLASIPSPADSNGAGLQLAPMTGPQPGSSALLQTLSLLPQSQSKMKAATRLWAEANLQLIAFMVFWHSTVKLFFLWQRLHPDTRVRSIMRLSPAEKMPSLPN